MIEKLKNLGLNDKEARVYLAALELGEASVQEIAQKSGVKRVTAHVAIEKLKIEGLLYEEKKGKRRRIIAEMPEKLIEILLNKKNKIEVQMAEFRKLLPELDSIYNYSEIKPKIRFFSDLDGLKQIYQDTLAVGEEILAFTAYHKADKKLAEWLDKVYIPARIKKNIKARVIAPSSEFARGHIELDKKQKRETLLVPRNKFPFSIEVNIYGPKVAIISFTQKELMGVVITSQEVSNTFKLIFKLAWQAALEYKKISD